MPSRISGTRATITARLGDDALHVESLDLAKPKQREEFLDRLAEVHPAIDRAAVRAELVRLAAEFAQDRPADEPAAEARPDAETLLAKMPPDVVAEARHMLESGDLLERVVNDIGALGVAGERELTLTCYLVGASRLLARPLAAIVQGPSSSGKSYVVDQVAALFPPEAVIHATQMTPQALAHMEPGSLEHRFIVGGERSRRENDDSAEATRLLREMLASGRLYKLMPLKQYGEIRTVTIEQRGPVAFIETTTMPRIFDEDANRCLLVSTDERPLQTRRVIGRLAAAYAGSLTPADVQRVIQKHHAAQRLLQQRAVVVPYAEQLGELVADERVQARRAFPQLMGMIQALCLLRQCQRRIDGEGRLIAEPEDYEVARRLLAGPMGRALGGRVSDPAARFYGRLSGWFSASETFTTRDARHRETACRRAVAGWISELHEAGAVAQVEPARGNSPARWWLGDLDSANLAGGLLPTAEQLFPAGGLHACPQDVSRCGARG